MSEQEENRLKSVIIPNICEFQQTIMRWIFFSGTFKKDANFRRKLSGANVRGETCNEQRNERKVKKAVTYRPLLPSELHKLNRASLHLHEKRRSQLHISILYET